MATIRSVTDSLAMRALNEHLRLDRERRLTVGIHLSAGFLAQMRAVEESIRSITLPEWAQLPSMRTPALTALQANQFAAERQHVLSQLPRVPEPHPAFSELTRMMDHNRDAMRQITELALVGRQAAWVDGITTALASVTADLGPTLRAMEAVRAVNFPWQDQLRDALSAIEFPFPHSDAVAASEFVEQIATEVERAAEEPGGPGIGAAVATVLSRLTGLDETGRAMAFFVVLLVVLTVLRESIGSVVEVEYDRWRNGPEDEVRAAEIRRQTEALEEIRRQLEDVRVQVSQPPLLGEVIRSARLRSAPATTAPLVRRLQPGVRLVVVERRDGWVRVEAEPTPGDVSEGWVYGRLVRYVR